MSASENMRVSPLANPSTPPTNAETDSQVEPKGPLEHEASTSVVTLAAASDGPQKPLAPADPTKRPAANRPAKKRPAVPPLPLAVEPGPIAPPVSVSVLKEMRRKRAKKLLLRVLLLVVLPTLTSAVYYGLFASNEFESTTVFVIERREPLHVTRGLTLNGPASDSSDEGAPKSETKFKATTHNVDLNGDAQLVKEFVLSRDMLAKLDKKLNLIAHYRNPQLDFASRLSSRASREQAHDYFTEKVSVVHNPGAATLTLKVRAFDSKTANQIAEAILSATEQTLNLVPRRALQDTLKLTESELERIKRISTRFDAEWATQLASAAPPVGAKAVSLSPELQTLSTRAEQYRQRLAVTEERVALLNDELTHKSRYIVRVAGPSEPDAASYPHRGRAVLTTLLFSIIAMGILSLMVSTIREHTNL